MNVPSAFADLEIRILANKDAAGNILYRAELTLDHGQEFGPGDAALGGVGPWEEALQSAEDYGAALFSKLFKDAGLKAGWDRARGQAGRRRIRLRIDADLPELHPITWELMHDPASGPYVPLSLSTATPFSRYLAQDWQPGAAVLKRPLKVLVAIANPSNLASVGLTEVDSTLELGALQAAVAGVVDEEGKPAVQLDLLPHPCTLDAIRDALKTGYHVLHYVGHGVRGPKGTALLLPDPANGDAVAYVTEQDVAAMLQARLADGAMDDEDRLRLVFLESCETAKRDSSDAFRGLAPALVKAGLPAVVAMQDLVEVTTARAFAAAFYRQLVCHGYVDLACNEARDAVRAQKLRGPEVPVLFMRLRSGELLKVRGNVANPNTKKFWGLLVANVNEETCVPFLGPRLNGGILPSSETLARRLAMDNGYGLADEGNLARVAQFEGYRDPKAFRSMFLNLLKHGVYRSLGREAETPAPKDLAKTSLTEITTALDWGARAVGLQDCRIYDQLAGLKLPLYITTNADTFLFEALRRDKTLTVRRAAPLWKKPDAGAPAHSLLDPEPSASDPYVLHLNGYDDSADPGQRDEIALSEEQFLEKFVRLARDQQEVLPSNVITRLAESSYVFLGFGIDDWEFRLVLQGLLKPIAQLGGQNRQHVGVQLEVDAMAQGLDEEGVRAYLERYLQGRFEITVYWGTPSQFMSELHRFYAY